MKTNIAVIAATVAAAMAPPADAALLGDVLKPFVSVSETYDSNVFRVKNREQLEGIIDSDRMSDFSTTASVGTDIHYEVSRQKLDLQLAHDFIRYSHFTELDTNRDLARGTVTLSVLDKLQLKLDGSYENYPQPRSEFRSGRLNKVTRSSAGGVASYEMTSGFGFEAGYTAAAVDYSLPTFRTREYSVDRYIGRITYRVSPMTRIYAGYQRDETDYRRREEDNNFSNVADSARLGIDITKMAKTSLSGYVGFVNRAHRHLPARDFQGFIGRLGASYMATPKLAVKLDWQRELYEETFADWIYSVTNSVSTTLVYQVAPKVRASATGKIEWKDFEKVPEGDTEKREDFLYEAGANFEWEAYRRLTLSVGYQYSDRSSNFDEFDFADHTTTVSLAYRF